MSAISKIQWTDATWTPIRARRKDTGKVGPHCEHVSEGCRNCYSEKNGERMLTHNGTGLPFTRQSRDLVNIFVDEKILTQPLRWKSPKKIFVCSQTDLFAEFVTDEMIDRVFAVMALCPQHTFQILTKRPDRMREYFGPSKELDGMTRDALVEGGAQRLHFERTGEDPSMWLAVHWPLPNVWLGVSVEDQKNADARIPYLLDTPAAKRFVSYEPALGAVNFAALDLKDQIMPLIANRPMSTESYENYPKTFPMNALTGDSDGGMTGKIDWIIVGGESGPGARPFNIEWARAVIAQGKSAGVACFVKQMGSHAQTRNDQVADVWHYADGSDMETREGPRHPEYQYQGGLVTLALKDRKGGDMAEWPEDLRLRQMPI